MGSLRKCSPSSRALWKYYIVAVHEECWLQSIPHRRSLHWTATKEWCLRVHVCVCQPTPVTLVLMVLFPPSGLWMNCKQSPGMRHLYQALLPWLSRRKWGPPFAWMTVEHSAQLEWMHMCGVYTGDSDSQCELSQLSTGRVCFQDPHKTYFLSLQTTRAVQMCNSTSTMPISTQHHSRITFLHNVCCT